jgi:hypothetical protein
MSLTAEQVRRTAAELAANLERAGLSAADLPRLTGWAPERVAAALALRGADPADVWRLRDVLVAAVRRAGRTPVPFTVLTEQARTAASRWFDLG